MHRGPVLEPWPPPGIAMLLLALSCRTQGPSQGPQGVVYAQSHQVTAITHAPSKGGGAISAERAFAVRALCPVIESAELKPSNPPFGALHLRLSGGAPVLEVQVSLPDGHHARAEPSLEDLGLVFPIACTDCTLYLVFEDQGEMLTCWGPGHALGLSNGLLEG